MSGYTSGNNAPTLMAQMTNRKGNVSKDPAKKGGGATNITNPKGGVMHAPGYTGNHSANGKVNGRNQPVQVSRPKADYCSCNDGYMKNSSYLK